MNFIGKLCIKGLRVKNILQEKNEGNFFYVGIRLTCNYGQKKGYVKEEYPASYGRFTSSLIPFTLNRLTL